MSSVDSLGAVDEAWACANAVAARHGLRVVEQAGLPALRQLADLLARVWHARSPDEIVNLSMLRNLAHSGNYVAGAYRGDDLVGASIGFFGQGHLHSFITGVEPGTQGRGVGYLLKQHQRAWTLSRGVPEVRWTYDPLVGRNAYFNLGKLGADVVEYLPEFYGSMTDGINAGDLSDRLYVHWRLASPRAVAAARGEAAEVDVGALLDGGARHLLDRVDGAPQSNVDDSRTSGAKTLLVAVPQDVEALRRDDPVGALQWRYAVRDALVPLMADGCRITGMSRYGFYVLERP